MWDTTALLRLEAPRAGGFHSCFIGHSLCTGIGASAGSWRETPVGHQLINRCGAVPSVHSLVLTQYVGQAGLCGPIDVWGWFCWDTHCRFTCRNTVSR